MPEPDILEPTLKPPVDDAGDGQVIPENRVKQGRRGYPALAVLAASTLLAVVLLFGAWSLFFGRLAARPDEGGETGAKTAAAHSFHQQGATPLTAGAASADAHR
jgi:hypothetical protein